MARGGKGSVRRAWALLALAAACATIAAESSAATDPDVEPGFPTKGFHDEGTYHGGPSVHVLVGNVDEEPTLEIFATSLATGPLFAWNADGSRLAGWPTRDEAGAAYPALGNLSNRSHAFEVVTGTWGQRDTDSRLNAHFGDGATVAGWPRTAVNFTDTPAMLVDVDGDGIDEVFTNEQDGVPHAYRADGTPLPGWPPAGGKPWSAQRTSTPAAADLDANGTPEIVGVAGSWVFAYRADGTAVPGFPVQPVASSYPDAYPAIGDVDGDGAQEIVVVLGGPTVVVLGPTGLVERTLTPARGVSYGTAPALADLDGDAVPEIVVQTDGALNVWKGNGTALAGWPVTWGDYSVGNGAPVVGDVDGDGLPDVVVTDHVAGLDQGEVRAYSRSGVLLAGFPKNPGLGSRVAAPAIADVDRDGRNEIVVAGSDEDFIGYFDDLWVLDLGGSAHGPVAWGQFMGGPRHEGRHGAPTAPPGAPAATGPPTSAPGRLVGDVNPGAASSMPREPGALNGVLYYQGTTAAAGAELWRSDGTAAGTTLVRDIRAGAAGSHARELTALGSTLLFVADDGVSGAELWRTDGTAAGTALVKDIWPGAAGSSPHDLTVVNGVLYFAAWDGANGWEPWRSDGTAAGTVMVKNIVAGAGASPNGGGAGSDPRALVALNGSLFFTAWSIDGSTNTHGIALLRSDGSAAGTTMLGNQYLSPTSQQWFPFDAEPVGPALYYTDGDRIGRSDGTSAGTAFFREIFVGGDALVGELESVGGTLFLRAREAGEGTEPWRVSGTTASRIKDIAPGAASSSPNGFAGLNGLAYFSASNGTDGHELWRSDGTDGGTALVKDIRVGGASSAPALLTPFDGKLYFTADGGSGHELWRTDGTGAGTQLVQDVAPGSRGSAIGWLAPVGDKLFFSADDGTNGQELWVLSPGGTTPPPPDQTFSDVPPTHPFFAEIEEMFDRGITQGCYHDGATGERRFCPQNNVTRQEMAVFIVRALGLPLLAPTTPTFGDVPATHAFYGHIERFYAEGITKGCQPSPLLYCPLANVTRQEMAVFIVRAKRLSLLTPATPTFGDVPADHVFYGHIERFFEQGITQGCQVSPRLFCPTANVTREAMAAFIIRAFPSP